MMEEIRIKILKKRQEIGVKISAYMPWSCIMISESLKQSYQDQAYGDQWYDVVEGGDRHVVDLVRKRCTFRTWDLTGISCPHAIKALLHVKQEPLPEVYWWYSKEAYMLMYLHKIQLVRGNKSWKVDPSHGMEPPEIHKMVGRPKVKRTRVKNEAMKRRGCGQLQERLKEAAQTVQDVSLSTSQANQDSEFVFMPNRGFNVSSSQQTSQSISEAAGPSKSKRKSKYKPVAPSKRSAKKSVACLQVQLLMKMKIKVDLKM